jgi:hypothetical protein
LGPDLEELMFDELVWLPEQLPLGELVFWME